MFIMDKAYYDSITQEIISCAYHVGNALGSGFLEKVYENAMAIELAIAKVKFELQKQIKVYYREQLVGEYCADLLVEEAVIVELKAVKNIENIHCAQCQNYLKATGIKLGLVINFGAEKVQVRRLANGV